MKRHLLSAMFFLSLALLGCAGSGSNAINTNSGKQPENPRDQATWVPTIMAETRDFVDFPRDDTVSHSGSPSLSIAIHADHPEQKIFYNWTRLATGWQVGRTYELTGWVKTEDLGGGASLMAQCWSEGHGEMLKLASTQKRFPLRGTNPWTRIGTTFTVPERTAKVRLRAGMLSLTNRGGQVWLDDIQLKEVAPDTSDVMAGTWSGALHAGAQKLRLVLHVDAGRWNVTLDSIDQGAKGLLVSSLDVSGNEVHFELERIHASYHGHFVGSDRIEGAWVQGVELPLDFERVTEEPVLSRPQEPKPPFPYLIQDVVYSFDPGNIRKTLQDQPAAGQSDFITLRGTLTLPPGDGPHPGVLLISGSGPQDRDESLMGHKPFWVLADYLTRHGLAVLRVDDRGTGRSTGSFRAATTEDFARDAAAGFLYLAGRAEIDSARVALLGHSEGGLIAPLVASQYPAVAAIVLMAGPGVPGREILQRQSELMLLANGAPPAEVAKQQQDLSGLVDIVSADDSAATISIRLDHYIKQVYAGFSDQEKDQAGSLAEYSQQIEQQMNSPWMRWFLRYDPTPVLQRVSCPVLAVNGAKDLQVDPEQNLPAVAAALKAGGNKDFKTLELPGLNHLFQHCQTGAVSEYSSIEETLAPEFLEAVTGWLQDKLEVAGSPASRTK